MPPVKPLDEVGVRLVDRAGRVLADEGPDGLSLRKLAGMVGTSTMTVYTRFGDKDGLLAAMHAEGFRRLGSALRAAAAKHPGDPLAALAAMGEAYRATALENRHLYPLMFGNAAPGFAPDESGRAVAHAAYEPLLNGVQLALNAGVLTGGTADRIALYLWAVSHGFVSLEVAGQLKVDPSEATATYRDALVLSALPFLVS
jgi:AcrR family transcriptional regulator